MTYAPIRAIIFAIILLVQVGCESRRPLARIEIGYDREKVDLVICEIKTTLRDYGFGISDGVGIVQDGEFRKFFLYAEMGGNFPLSIHNMEDGGNIVIYIYEERPENNGKVIDVDSLVRSIKAAISGLEKDKVPGKICY